jgi:2-C-methyl-D-erythritol 2,4-cyclodiphosphate synthase
VIRTGIGYDSHRFGADRPLILGGVNIPGSPGLVGHSDADAVAHALTDALLGAAALGDIGGMFPDSDPQWKDADSMRLLAFAVVRLREAGWVPQQCDLTIVLESPKLAPHINAIRHALAGVLEIPVDAVSCKAKTNEHMGFVGRGEGLAVLAVASVAPAT